VDNGIPPGIYPELVATPDLGVAPGAPRIDPSFLPAQIGYVGFIDPRSAPEADFSDLVEGGVELWITDEAGTYKIFKPGLYRLKPTLQELKLEVEGKLTDFVYPWEFQDKVDEVVEQPRWFTFENYRITKPVSEEDARWIMRRCPNVSRPTWPQFGLCPMHSVHQCTFVAKHKDSMDDHIRKAHG
jgi:hypothetical protein